MSWSEQLTEYSRRFWEKRRSFLGAAGEAADAVLKNCSPDERTLLQYILATLPLSDLGDYGPGFFLSFVKNALRAREEFSWCAGLPERFFLLNVAYPRINTEELADCRELFHNALADRVRGLSLEDAVLEVNRWCAEEATYRSTDLCTASPLTVYRCGYGRCGEESTFAVTALRSVGIAARQVYAPWWSHCDDNHAWVEVFDGKRWRYLGACEPEPELDRGWFTSAASRAVMIHARAFVQGEKEDIAFLFPEVDPSGLHVEQGVAYETVTARYAETRVVTVTVRDGEGKPVPGAELSFSLLNMARFSEIAARKTGPDGSAALRLGLGTVKASAFWKGGCAEALFDVSQTDKLELVLEGPSCGSPGWSDFTFSAPVGALGYPTPLSREQKRLRREWLDSAAALREQKAARRESQDVSGLSCQEARVWSTLTEKDRSGGIREDVLRDNMAAFSWEAEYPPEVFETALLCPRIGLEPLVPWRQELSSAFSEEDRKSFRQQPQRLWEWVEEKIREVDHYAALSGTPAGIFRLRAAGPEGKRVLFCALCRSCGIPARLSPLHGGPEYYKDGVFQPAGREKAAGRVIFQASRQQAALDFQNFTLARWQKGRYAALHVGDIPAGENRAFMLEPGRYLAVTVSRMPNGNQLARQLEFSLSAGEEGEIVLSFREGKAVDMLECQALPPFVLRGRAGKEQDSGSLLGKAAFSILFWLEVGREPTEHILNELRGSAAAFADSGCALHFILENGEQEHDPTLGKTLSLLSNSGGKHGGCAPQIWYGDFQDTVPVLARQMFGDPDKLPLVILTDCKGNGLYSCSGYNVGTGELLLRLLAELTGR